MATAPKKPTGKKPTGKKPAPKKPAGRKAADPGIGFPPADKQLRGLGKILGPFLGLIVGLVGGQQLQLGGPVSAPAYHLEANQVVSRFSPRGGVLEQVIAHIRNAKKQILVQAYDLTSGPITEALIEAHRRGVEVIVLADKARAKQQSSTINELIRHGIPVYGAGGGKIAHTKAMFFDEMEMAIGSYNWTTNAEKNIETCMFIANEELVRVHMQQFYKIKEHPATTRIAGQARI